MPDAPPIRRWPLLLLAIPLLLAGCAPGPTGDQAPLPTLGPISERGGIKNKVLYEMTASTNCVSVGEPVTFTMTIINPSTVPITISTTPMVDFIIRPVSKAPDEQQATRIRRWSQAPDYPTIDPVIPAQQQRSFQWSWTAEPGFAVPDEYGVRVQFYTGALELYQRQRIPGGSELFLSVLAPPDPKQYHFSCEDLRPKP